MSECIHCGSADGEMFMTQSPTQHISRSECVASLRTRLAELGEQHNILIIERDEFADTVGRSKELLLAAKIVLVRLGERARFTDIDLADLHAIKGLRQAVDALKEAPMTDKKKPTVAELEAMMQEPGYVEQIQPSGEVRAVMKSDVDTLRKRLSEVENENKNLHATTRDTWQDVLYLVGILDETLQYIALHHKKDVCGCEVCEMREKIQHALRQFEGPRPDEDGPHEE